MEGGELGAVGQVDGQGRLALGFPAVLLNQVFDGGEGGSFALQSLQERDPQKVGAVELEQSSQPGGQEGSTSMASKGGVEEGLDLGDGKP
jgi:hypothetical protein